MISSEQKLVPKTSEGDAKRECTKERPDLGATYHEGSTLVKSYVGRDGDHEKYECSDCGAQWEI